ncbi:MULTISPECIES: WhiB family transcriptional regulator [Streptomyces]|uniref:Transcriptional regulator WhiB n=1 Tax=Streptomyces fradiae ATCC 10745 = DSM 40063 TaxID=1319510 RepID=A0A1Y2NQC6_STRFR|nr:MULTISPECIES: WhiB family transcriptional regulator [Streptomyces]KAF0650623.1 hypothetical protein K701_06395 [Streptomyces fradiae ATCC 10745 = DSM 40063]OSY49703.1 Transcriptional regulator WhiB [Streptomyces fradiae ATCC 10745 = DSM 40063]
MPSAPHPSPPPSEVMEFFGWRAAAACSGLPPHVVFARREAEAAPALAACGRCPVVRRCLEAVAPAESWFDGVSGGRLWRNGRPVRLRRDTDGTHRTGGTGGTGGARAA